MDNMPNGSDNHKLAEQILNLSERLNEMSGRLGSSVRLLSSISALTSIPAGIESLHVAARRITETIVAELNDVTACSLLTYREETDSLQLLAAFGQMELLGLDHAGYNRALSFRPGEGIAGRAFKDNRPIFWDSQSPHADLLKKESGLSTPISLAALPLESMGRKLGVMNISFGEEKPFDRPRQRETILLGNVVATILRTFLLKDEIEGASRRPIRIQDRNQLEFPENAGAKRALQSRIRELNILHTFARQVGLDLSMDGVIGSALRLVAESVAPDGAYFFLRDGNRLLTRGSMSGGKEEDPKDPGIHLMGECLCGLAAEHGEPAFSYDIHSDPRCIREECKHAHFKSFAALPLISRGQAIGLIGIGSLTHRRFDEEKPFLQAMANEVALALHNAQLLEQLHQRAEDLQQRLIEIEMTQEALKESEQRFRYLFNGINDWISTHDIEGNILTVNRSAAEALGYAEEGVAGRNMSEFIARDVDPELFQSYLEKIKEEGQAFGVVSYESREGARYLIEYRSVLVTDPDGNVFVNAVGRDITGRYEADRKMKLLQDQLQQAQKMEALGTLAGGIAHDFNNLLQVISGHSHLMLDSHSLDRANEERLTSISLAAERANALVRQLLTFSRKIEPKLSSIDLHDVVRETLLLLERTIPKMIALEARLPGGLLKVKADPAQLEQILLNLATNARDAMPEGGRITIECENVRIDSHTRPQPLPLPDGDYVRIVFQDSGPGIPPNILAHIFEPFFTTKELGKGTGLGLSTVFGIVKAHGGYVDSVSPPGEGARFDIWLPALSGSGDAVSKTESQPQDDEESPGQETILVVDDEPVIARLLRDYLHQMGYSVFTAETGEQAIEIYQKEKAGIDLMILDLDMPGMGGKKCLKALKELDPHVQVVVASGYFTHIEQEELMNLGALDIIKKPYKLRDMNALIRKSIKHSDSPPRYFEEPNLKEK
ncbi:MAG: GAF domain-containing protein [Deltaproteobacteria bacterium]|nr:GAF domain-containing protein [Deltaproteobacteria bacterium]